MSSSKQNKVKINSFDDDFKRYFSKLTCRKCIWYYFNLKEYFVIATNDNSGYDSSADKNKYINILSEYRPLHFTMHLMEFKDKEFYDKIYETLKIPKNKIIKINTNKLFSSLNKIKSKDDVEYIYDEKKSELILKHNDESIVYGFDISDDYQSISTLSIVADQLHNYNKEYINEFEHIVCDLNDCQLTGNYIIKNCIHDDKINTIKFNILLIDGLDNVSYKEFINKGNDQINKLIYWFIDKKMVRFLSIYEDNKVLVKTIRPYGGIFPFKPIRENKTNDR